MSGEGRGRGGDETGVVNLLLPTELLVAFPTPSLPVVFDRVAGSHLQNQLNSFSP